MCHARTALAQPEPVAPTASDVTELSPVAQAVKDAAYTLPIGSGLRSRIAAALRAAAGCVPKGDWGGENYATGFRDGIAFSCQFLHELAAELDNSNNTSEGIMAITQPVPVRTPDGKIHEFILNVDGKRFFCPCNCNVFHKPDDRDLELYQCNCCGTQFNSP